MNEALSRHQRRRYRLCLVLQVGKKLTIGTRHVPRHHIVGQKLKQLTNRQRAGMKVFDQ